MPPAAGDDVRVHEHSAGAQKGIRRTEGGRHVAREEEGALAERRVKAARREGRGEDVAALHIRPGGEVDAHGAEAPRAQGSHSVPIACAEVNDAAGRGYPGQGQEAQRGGFAAGMAGHLSSSTFSTESTLPMASSSGT